MCLDLEHLPYRGHGQDGTALSRLYDVKERGDHFDDQVEPSPQITQEFSCGQNRSYELFMASSDVR